VLTSGTAKIGKREYDVLINGSTDTIQALNNLPVKQVNGATIYIRDIANVRHGYTPQVNMVVSNGIKAALLPVLKNGDASTLDVSTYDYLKKIREQLIAKYPNYTYFSMPADIVSQILNAVYRCGLFGRLGKCPDRSEAF